MSARRFMVKASGLLLMLAFGGLSLWAQFTSAIEGTVTDPSGAVVPNATVNLKNAATEVTRTVQTSSTGNYRVPSLPAATFDVTVSASGFKTTIEKGGRLEVA